MTTGNGTQAMPDHSMQDVVAMFGGGFGVADIEATMRAVMQSQTARVAFHAWTPLKNYSAKGTKWGLPYVRLERMTAILVPVLQTVSFEGKPGFSTHASLQTSQVVPTVGTTPTPVQRTPDQTMADMVRAWGKVGLVELKSLASRDAEELLYSNLLLEGLLHTPAADEGVVLADLILEDIFYTGVVPNHVSWVRDSGPSVLRQIIDNGVEFQNKRWKLNLDALERGNLLLSEIAASVRMATDRALNANDGILPKFKKLRNKAMNGQTDGRGYATDEEEWLMRQFPSYQMDTDTERSTNAIIDANRANPATEALGMVIEGNQRLLEQMNKGQDTLIEMIKQNAETTAMLAKIVVAQSGKAAE